MNFYYRITKYNPIYRDENGAYIKDEWISYSDVGEAFGGEKLTLNEYLDVENKYIDSIIAFMNCSNFQALKVSSLEIIESPEIDKNSTEQMVGIYKNIKNNATFSIGDIKDLCRLILRNYIWCKLVADTNLEIHFGYDYYMYIVSRLACANVVRDIQKNGLFVEKYESPYL
jgi:hypothetical protein